MGCGCSQTQCPAQQTSQRGLAKDGARLPLSLQLMLKHGACALDVMLMCADKASPFQMVQALSSQLQEVPAEDVLLSLHHVPQVCS